MPSMKPFRDQPVDTVQTNPAGGVLSDLVAERLLIFTDLDGSLLDHHDYSFAAALPTLQQLERQAVPVICCTSKTFDEMLPLRLALGNEHPFIVENGAAVYIPEGYFNGADEPMLSGAWPEPCDALEGYLGFAFCQPRNHWLQLLKSLPQFLQEPFVGFTQLGAEGISELTGLSLAEAGLANQRQFSEPLQWCGDPALQQAFVAELNNLGARVLCGGRFLHVSGACNKGTALTWLTSVYQQVWQRPVKTLALGDSHNDVAMLEVADMAVVIRSPVHSPLRLATPLAPYTSQHMGPAGWAEGVAFFQQLDSISEE